MLTKHLKEMFRITRFDQKPTCTSYNLFPIFKMTRTIGKEENQGSNCKSVYQLVFLGTGYVEDLNGCQLNLMNKWFEEQHICIKPPHCL